MPPLYSNMSQIQALIARRGLPGMPAAGWLAARLRLAAAGCGKAEDCYHNGDSFATRVLKIPLLPSDHPAYKEKFFILEIIDKAGNKTRQSLIFRGARYG